MDCSNTVRTDMIPSLLKPVKEHYYGCIRKVQDVR